jgi:hypothetical protein
MGGERQMGLYNKYCVTRNDETDKIGEKHHGCQYFVLDLTHDPHAKSAILAYARACRETHPALSKDLQDLSRSSKFAGGRAPNGVRCLGARPDNNLARCKNVYSGQEGWDFVGVRPFDGWVCPDCRRRFLGIFNQPGLPKPAARTRKKRRSVPATDGRSMRAAARRNARAFGSTKSKDGQYPI